MTNTNKRQRFNIDKSLIKFYQDVLDDLSPTFLKTLPPKERVMLGKMAQQISNAIKYDVPIQVEMLTKEFWLGPKHDEYLYFCKENNFVPYSAEAGKFVNLVWTGGKNDPNQVISNNTVVWRVAHAELDTTIRSQDEIDNQFLAPGHYHHRAFDFSKKDGATIKTGVSIKLPVKNKHKIELVRIDYLNLHPSQRKVFYQKDDATGKFIYVDYDPAKHSHIDNSYLIPLQSVATERIDTDLFKMNAVMFPREFRDVTNLIVKTGLKTLVEYEKTAGKTKAKAAVKLIKIYPEFPISLDGETIKDLKSELAKSTNRQKKYHVYSPLGYPLTTEGLSMTELNRFFSSYARGTLYSKAAQGKPAFHAGRSYLISRAGNDTSRFPTKAKEKLDALKLQEEFFTQLLEGAEHTVCASITKEVTLMMLLGRTKTQISEALGLGRHAVEQHMRNGKASALKTARFHNQLMDGSVPTYDHTPTRTSSRPSQPMVNAKLHLFGELPKMKNYFTDIVKEYEQLPPNA